MTFDDLDLLEDLKVSLVYATKICIRFLEHIVTFCKVMKKYISTRKRKFITWIVEICCKLKSNYP